MRPGDSTVLSSRERNFSYFLSLCVCVFASLSLSHIQCPAVLRALSLLTPEPIVVTFSYIVQPILRLFEEAEAGHVPVCLISKTTGRVRTVGQMHELLACRSTFCPSDSRLYSLVTTAQIFEVQAHAPKQSMVELQHVLSSCLNADLRFDNMRQIEVCQHKTHPKP